MAETQRYNVLDTYRYFAAIGVVIYHFEANFQQFLKSPTDALHSFHLLVDFFFVLSGFVLMHTYGGRIGSWSDFTAFMRKRLARVYPLHFVTTLVFVALALVVKIYALPTNHPETLDLSLTPSHLLLVHAWGLSDHPGLNFASWSISSELFVYLLFPLFALLLARLGGWKTLMLAVAFAIAMTLIRNAFGLRTWTQATFDFGNLRAVPTFLAGMAIYVLVTQAPARRLSWFWPHVYALALVALMLLRVNEYVVVALVPGLIALLALAERGGAPTVLGNRFFHTLGDASYGVYMIHAIVINLMLVALRKTGWTSEPQLVLALIVGCVLTTILAIYSFRWFENPMRRWLGRAS